MLQIGSVRLENNVFLAPMAGVTDRPFRRICKRYGAGLVYSEMVSAKALYYGDRKTKQLLASCPEEQPLAVQIFGSDPEIMAIGARAALETGAAILDINMGCPAPKIVKNGEGSALMRDPELIYRIVRAVTAAVEVPVTCKIRSGFDCICAVDTAKAVEAGGAAAVAVHPRTREMYYSGQADWDIIRQVKQAVSIPVIGNGDIFMPADAGRMLEQTGCDAVMIGRGAQGNPFLFRQVLDYLQTGRVSYHPDVAERMAVLEEHLRLLIEEKGEHIGVCEARKHVAWYIKGMRDCAKMRSFVNTVADPSELFAALEGYARHCMAKEGEDECAREIDCL